MSPKRVRINVIIFGLEEDLSNHLEAAVTRTGIVLGTKEAASPEECIDSIRDDERDVIFCGPNLADIRTLRDRCPNAAIIVLSRAAEVSDWIDALEAGADDYYAVPLDQMQVEWMLQLLSSRAKAA
jgi:DNA-binding response OmpR family regulator